MLLPLALLALIAGCAAHSQLQCLNIHPDQNLRTYNPLQDWNCLASTRGYMPDCDVPSPRGMAGPINNLNASSCDGYADDRDGLAGQSWKPNPYDAAAGDFRFLCRFAWDQAGQGMLTNVNDAYTGGSTAWIPDHYKGKLRLGPKGVFKQGAPLRMVWHQRNHADDPGSSDVSVYFFPMAGRTRDPSYNEVVATQPACTVPYKGNGDSCTNIGYPDGLPLSVRPFLPACDSRAQCSVPNVADGEYLVFWRWEHLGSTWSACADITVSSSAPTTASGSTSSSSSSSTSTSGSGSTSGGSAGPCVQIPDQWVYSSSPQMSFYATVNLPESRLYTWDLKPKIQTLVGLEGILTATTYSTSSASTTYSIDIWAQKEELVRRLEAGLASADATALGMPGLRFHRLPTGQGIRNAPGCAVGGTSSSGSSSSTTGNPSNNVGFPALPWPKGPSGELQMIATISVADGSVQPWEFLSRFQTLFGITQGISAQKYMGGAAVSSFRFQIWSAEIAATIQTRLAAGVSLTEASNAQLPGLYLQADRSTDNGDVSGVKNLDCPVNTEWTFTATLAVPKGRVSESQFAFLFSTAFGIPMDAITVVVDASASSSTSSSYKVTISAQYAEAACQGLKSDTSSDALAGMQINGGDEVSSAAQLGVSAAVAAMAAALLA